jgi:hypothetical protein
MATTMIRKQVYLERAQDRKLKALAKLRHCTEAEVIRDALDRLPDPEGSVVEQLAAAGLLAPKPPLDEVLSDEELRALEAEVDAWLDQLPEPLNLAEAVLADREGR